jgi:Tol biopolymer transport system component
LGGKPRRILDDAGWADWAKKSQTLAVVRDTGGERVLETRDSGGRQKRTLFHTVGAITWVRVSPDERIVAFVHHPSRFDDQGEIRIAALDGSFSKSLTQRFERCSGLDWNRRTGEIWFTASSNTLYSSTLWAVGLSGKPRVLYVLPDSFVLQSIGEEGNRFLLLASERGISLMLRRSGGAVEDLSWLGWTLAADVSPDQRTLLFYDGGANQRTAGIWIRPLEGGDAVRVGDGEPGRFSPDGRWIIAASRPPSTPAQLLLYPVGTGSPRELTHSEASHSHPSFAGPERILFVRTEHGASAVWTMLIDGTEARRIGAPGCDMPTANPAGTVFLCRGGNQRNTIFLYSLEPSFGPRVSRLPRKLYELARSGLIVYARWNSRGDRIFVVPDDGRVITLDADSGSVLAEERVSLQTLGSALTIYAAAFTPEGTIQAYSIDRLSSGLYLSSGIR